MKVRSQCHIFVNIADETKRGGAENAMPGFHFFEHVLLGEINEEAHDLLCA